MNMASQQSRLDTEEAERKRKQRELKRKSGERQKQRNLMELQLTAQALELEYKQLISERSVDKEQDERQQCESVAYRLVELQSKYAAVRQEMQELRDQMTGLKQKLEKYERFIAVLDGQLMGFQETQTNPQKE
ncbi:hypothetical protein PsorP6_003463 [Peronosclerospora sorghi]|uniref:Uncharacterized protein n=1 Tax=Peronosclerospora sorghi TaxID=230839 RepID=A0ACC0VP27_9STRA|nr:hypothetical protein PsorP6_003463 [Peronosclerospora sorghi]